MAIALPQSRLERENAAWRLGQALLCWCTLAALGGLAVAAPPAAVLSLVGLLPTMGAWIADRGRRPYLALCVASTNLCGIVPIALDRLRDGASGPLVQSLADPTAWLVMYGGAGIGWLLYLGIPPLVQASIIRRIRRQRHRLLRRQRQLAEEWGDAFASSGEGGQPPTATVV